jgi:hypothetical protein
MSRIYAAGNKATAVANIKTDVATFISFNTNGEKVLNVEGLVQYLEAQFAAISTDAEFIAPATAASAAAAAKSVATRQIADSLNNVVQLGHWTGRSDFPTATTVLTGSTLVSAIKDGIAELTRLSNAISDYYVSVANVLRQKLTDFYGSQGIDALVPAGVVRQIETRAVICTYVTDWDEESAPSPASALAEMDQNDSATYTAPSPPSGRHINRIRWYRSQSTNTGANFTFVDEVASTSLSYLDEKKAEELQEPCPTTTWAEPPANLIGLTEGPNGGMAGFFDNTVCPCENFVPYAFPVEYQKTTAWPIVGIGRFDSTYVVLTRGKPYFMSGADSASLDSVPVDSSQACVSRRSIVNVEGGVIYASPDGLCVASASGVQLLTQEHFNREEWQALVPASIFAIEHDGSYIFHYDTGSASGCYALDLKDGKLTTIDATGSAFFRDLVNDTLYLASGTTIKSLFTAGSKRTGTWKSKIMVMPSYANLGWLQANSDFEAPVTVKLYREGVLTDTKVLTGREPVRVSSKRAIEHEVQIESAARVTGVTLASTAQELRGL